MRNMLAFIAALVITLGAIGFYLDWFNIRRTPGPEGNTSFQFDVNTRKIAEDAHKVEEKLQQRLSEKSQSGGEVSTEKNKPEQRPHRRTSSNRHGEKNSHPDHSHLPYAIELQPPEVENIQMGRDR